MIEDGDETECVLVGTGRRDGVGINVAKVKCYVILETRTANAMITPIYISLAL